MKAIEFDFNIHFDEITKWISDRGMNQVGKQFYPKIGRIVPGVACIFLYRTDSQVAFIENLITNHEQKPLVISEAVELCVKAIEKDALEEGVHFLWSNTHIPGVIERARKLGFRVRDQKYRLMSKELSKWAL